MGIAKVTSIHHIKRQNTFARQLLKDLHGLERMLAEDWFEKEDMHIGAEQEICLVDNHYKPSLIAMELLQELNDPSFVTELAKFNLELNLDPLPLKGNCFWQMEHNIRGSLTLLAKTMERFDAEYVITGILPTLRKFDLGQHAMTPLPRYAALIESINRLRGKVHELHINGLDELNVRHDSAMLEACNTSFQVHLQTSPEEFVKMYNIAQAIAAPALAISVNSPLLFGKRLWSETRVALFQQTIDTRITSEHLRDRSPRVSFGNSWLKDSIVEMYKDDIVRFRAMLYSEVGEDTDNLLDRGICPKLKALMIHNGTVYKWNRPCYGISPSGRPHLRIENRVFPAGPTVVDQVANAAFWIGAMKGMALAYEDITQVMAFDHAKENFYLAARNGLNNKFTWVGGEKISVEKLIADKLIPIAKVGLESCGVDTADINKYLGIIWERNETKRTGAQWMVDSFAKLQKETTREKIPIAITANMKKNQDIGSPVHEWPLASLDAVQHWQHHSLLVEEFMTTDLFTVSPNDLPELVAEMMVWRKLKNIPVDDDRSVLKGLINYRQLLQYLVNKQGHKEKKEIKVEDLMATNPVVVSPDDTLPEALQLMKENSLDCLPVVKNGKLVGIITEGNFMAITLGLLRDSVKA